MNLREKLVSQFGKPQGILGHVAGIIMALRPSNKERNRWTLDLLQIKPDDHVLEIGFGPGFAIQHVSKMLAKGKITGIDYSETMLLQAKTRNHEDLKKGKVDLKLGSIEQLPAFESPFNKIYSVNSIQFWPNPVKSLTQLKELLTQDGRIAITFQPRQKNATNADAQKMGKKIFTQLKKAGYKNIQMETKEMQPVNTVCVIGYKS
ncbi:methyltransferase domain-containing protein [Deltaproteobacteria bacterium TL4]